MEPWEHLAKTLDFVDQALGLKEKTMKTQKEVKHTPTPWKHGVTVSGHQAIYNNRGNQLVAFGEGQDEYWREPKNAEANAAFIVRAVNSHDALLEAAKTVLAYHKRPTGQIAYVLGELEKAIAKAEGRS